MAKIEEYIQFPNIFTFKIVGENNPTFTFSVEEIFNEYKERSIVPKLSCGEKYISLSATVELGSYDELEKIYSQISTLNGVRFYV